MHDELVLIDQPQLRQRQRELYASHEQSLTRLSLELLNGRPYVRIFFKVLTRKGAFAVASVSTAGVRAWTTNPVLGEFRV